MCSTANLLRGTLLSTSILYKIVFTHELHLFSVPDTGASGRLSAKLSFYYIDQNNA